MTYIAGWKYRDSVYLLADMALTGVPQMSERSSFGELRAQFMGGNVEEAALKLVPIAPGTALAYAGDVALAQGIIKFISDNLQPANTPAQIFQAVETSMGPFNSARPVELLLAHAPANGSATLTYWSTANGIDNAATEFADAGSLEDRFKRHVRNIVQGFINDPPIDEESLLARATSAVQLYGRHENLMAQGVGGTFWGLRVYAGQTRWQDDTVFLMYQAISPQTSTHLVMAGVRNDVLIVYSDHTGACRYFGLPFLSSKPWVQWWQDAWPALPPSSKPQRLLTSMTRTTTAPIAGSASTRRGYRLQSCGRIWEMTSRLLRSGSDCGVTGAARDRL